LVLWSFLSCFVLSFYSLCLIVLLQRLNCTKWPFICIYVTEKLLTRHIYSEWDPQRPLGNLYDCWCFTGRVPGTVITVSTTLCSCIVLICLIYTLEFGYCLCMTVSWWCMPINWWDTGDIQWPTRMFSHLQPYNIHTDSLMYNINETQIVRRLKVMWYKWMFYVQLQASNEDGTSPWSDVVQYRTLCDRPRPPSKPQTKGKLYPDSFRVIWGLYFPSVFPVSACVISRLHSLQAKATSYVLVCVLCFFLFFCFFLWRNCSATAGRIFIKSSPTENVYF